MEQKSGFMNRLNNWMTPERSLALQGLGVGLSQMAAGQPANLSFAHQALMQRQQNAQYRQVLENSGIMSKFTPDQQAILAQMPPAAAQKIIAQAMFQPAPAPIKGVEINGQLVNPVTGKVIADLRDAQTDRKTIKGADGYNYYIDTGERVLPDVEQPRGAQSIIVSGDGLEQYGIIDDGRAYNITIGPDGVEARPVGGSGTNVTVNNGSEVGTIPQGYQLLKDEETGAFSMAPIPGGPADPTQANKVAQEAKSRSGGVVTEDIERALDIVEKTPGWTTGFGAILSSFPGTQSKTLAGLLTTIRANVGFDRLQAMRDSSPTGGALGAINQQEMGLLMNALGNLEQTQKAGDLTRNLERLNDIYLKIIHGDASAASGDPLGLFQ